MIIMLCACEPKGVSTTEEWCSPSGAQSIHMWTSLCTLCSAPVHCCWVSIVYGHPIYAQIPHPHSPWHTMHSLAGQPLRKREEGSGVMPICDLYRCSQDRVQPQSDLANILWSYLNTRADQSDACSSFLINCYDRQPHEDLAPGWSERVVGTTPTVYWTRRVGLWLVGLHISSHTILVVTWSNLIGLHSWLQRYKSRIGMTPDPSSL